jgi:hypothetical protein
MFKIAMPSASAAKCPVTIASRTITTQHIAIRTSIPSNTRPTLLRKSWNLRHGLYATYEPSASRPEYLPRCAA